MTVLEFIIAIVSSDVVTFILTFIFSRRRRKTEDKELEIKVLHENIEFLQNREDILNKALEDAVAKVVELQKRILELTSASENTEQN